MRSHLRTKKKCDRTFAHKAYLIKRAENNRNHPIRSCDRAQRFYRQIYLPNLISYLFGQTLALVFRSS